MSENNTFARKEMNRSTWSLLSRSLYGRWVFTLALRCQPTKACYWARTQGHRRRMRRRRRAGGSVPWERSDLVSETPVHTHPRYCDTAFLSVPREHKPSGLVSASQCPREQSPSAETKRGWLRCHLHHKGKPFLPEPLWLCAALCITFISDSGPTWYLPFVFGRLCLPRVYSFFLGHMSIHCGPYQPLPRLLVSLHQHRLLSVFASSFVLCARSPSGWLAVSQLSQRADTWDKSPASRCQNLTGLSVALGHWEHPSRGAASKQMCFIWLVFWAGSALV